MVPRCCLCRNPVSGDHRRRKKLHGAGCTKAKAVLRSLSSVPLEALVEMSDQGAILCYNCEKSLNNIRSLEEKIEGLKSEITTKLSALGEASRDHDGPPQAKHRHVDDGTRHMAITVGPPFPTESGTTAVETPSLPSISVSVEPVQESSPDVQVGFYMILQVNLYYCYNNYVYRL